MKVSSYIKERVMHLYYVGGLTTGEIAEKLDIPECKICEIVGKTY